MTQDAAEVGLLTFQQTVEFTESIALLSTAWTLLCAGLIEGQEAILWIRNGFWEDYRLASITKVLEGEPAAKYLTASGRFAPNDKPRAVRAFNLTLPSSSSILRINTRDGAGRGDTHYYAVTNWHLACQGISGAI